MVVVTIHHNRALRLRTVVTYLSIETYEKGGVDERFLQSHT
jgi:hypothetical protein